MHARKLLFLIGGSAAYAPVAEEFIPAAGGREARIALGIDDAACAVFQDEVFTGTVGQAVYEIEMLDFEDRAHRMRRRASFAWPGADGGRNN